MPVRDPSRKFIFDPAKRFEEQTIYEAPVGGDVTPSEATEFTKGLVRGRESLRSGLAGAGALVSDVAGAEDATQLFETGVARAGEVSQRHAPRVGSLAEAETAEDYFDFLVGGAAESIPFLATTIGTGGTAGLAAKGLGYGVKGIRAARGGGAFTSIAVPETGFTSEEILKETGERRPGLALAAGAAKGALDVYSLGKGLQTFLPKSIRGGNVSALRDIGTTAVREGVTEAAQELIDIGAVRTAEEADVFKALSPEEFQRALDVAALGATGGATFGAVGRTAAAIVPKIEAALGDKPVTPENIAQRFRDFGEQLGPERSEAFAKQQGFTSFAELQEFMERNAGVAQPEDITEYGTLDEAEAAPVDEFFYEGGVPWPSVSTWQQAGVTATDKLTETYEAMLFEDEVAQEAYAEALEGGATEQEARQAMEIASSLEIRTALDLAIKRAQQSGFSTEETAKEIADGIVAKWPKLQAVRERMGDRAFLQQSRYIEKSDPEAVPFRDLQIDEESFLGTLHEERYDPKTKKRFVGRDRIPIEMEVGGKPKRFGLDLQRLTNAMLQRMRGTHRDATDIQRFGDAFFAGLSSINNISGVNAEKLNATLEKIQKMSRAEKEELIVYRTGKRAYSYAELEDARTPEAEPARAEVDVAEAEYQRLRKIDRQIEDLALEASVEGVTLDRLDAIEKEIEAIYRKNPNLEFLMKRAARELAKARAAYKGRDPGTAVFEGVEEAGKEAPGELEAEPIQPLRPGEQGVEVPESRAPEIRNQTKDSSTFFNEENNSFEQGEMSGTNWATDERFIYIVEQANKMIKELGLEGRATIVTPDTMMALADISEDLADLQSGALEGQAATREAYLARAESMAEKRGVPVEQVIAEIRDVSGIDLNVHEYFIYVNPKMGKRRTLRTLSHEVGHIVLFDGLKRGNMSGDIITEYHEWLSHLEDEKTLVRDLLKDREAADAIALTLANVRVSHFKQIHPEKYAYLTDFHEWFADRVRNRLVDPEPPKNNFEALLDKIIKKLRRLFNMNVAVENTVEEYVEALMRTSRSNAWSTTATPHEVLNAWQEEIRRSEGVTQPPVSFEEMAGAGTYGAINSYLKRVLGRKMNPDDINFFHHMTSMHFKDVMGAAFNLAARDGFRKLMNTEEFEILSNALNSNYVKRQMAFILRNSPEAWQEAKNNPDAMMAYAYQFWITGQLKLSRKSTGIMQKIFDFFKDLLGIVLESENAEMLLNEFTTGNAYLRSQGVSEAQFHAKAAARDTMLQRIVHDYVAPAWKGVADSRFGTALFSTASTRMHDTRNQWLIKIANKVFAKVGTQFEGEDMLSQRTRMIGRFRDRAYRIYKGQSKEFGQRVVAMLNEGRTFTPEQTHTKSDAFKALSPEEQAVIRTRHLMNEMHEYMKEARMNIGFHENYFPWIFDEEQVRARKQELIALLAAPEFAEVLNEKKWTPEGIVHGIIQSRGLADTEIEVDAIGHTPAMSAINQRTLAFIEELGTPEQRKLLGSFFSDDIGHTFNTYIEQAVKRTEYHRRFGNGQLAVMIKKAAQHGATNEQLEMAQTYIDAVMGTHGYETNRRLSELLDLDPPEPGEIVNPKLQRGMGMMMVYQNVRTLALATLTSLADPVGIAVRTGDVGIAWQSWRRGLQTAFGNAQGDQKILLDMAEALGVVDRHMTVEALNWEYGGVYITGPERRINEEFFRWTGLQGWTRATRIMGLEAGIRFIARHATNPNQHSERLLAELNLSPNDVVLDENGRVQLMSPAQRRASTPQERARDDRIRAALHRFVDGAILRPNAALRPIWASDPHFMLFFHLKSFMYSFHEQILKRVVTETAEGNLAPLLMFGLFIPAMLGADMLRDLIRFGGGSNPQKAQWDVMDYITESVQRSGMLGLGQIAIDAGQDIKYGGIGYESFSGPTWQQLEDITLKEDYNWVNASPFQTVTKHYWENE